MSLRTVLSAAPRGDGAAIALPASPIKTCPRPSTFNSDGLHPYREEDVATSWARIPGTSSVLIAITRRAVIERFVTLFEKPAFKWARLHARLPRSIPRCVCFGGEALPSSGLLAYEPAESGVEIRRSASRPVFPATFDVPLERAAPMAASELRLKRTPRRMA
jgi:hypothetical protein